MMKKVRNILLTCLTVLSVVSVSTISANAEWRQDTTGWWYAYGNSWYTGWKQIDGKWYYFYSNGYMAHDTVIDGYTLGADGAWIESKPLVQEKTADLTKKLSSGLTLYEAAQSIQSTIDIIEENGDRIEDNMDLINKQCANLGTTYDEIKSLLDSNTSRQISQNQRKAEAQVNAQGGQYNAGNTGGASVPKAQAKPGMEMTGEPDPMYKHTTDPEERARERAEYEARNQGQHKDGYAQISGTVEDKSFEQNIKRAN